MKYVNILKIAQVQEIKIDLNSFEEQRVFIYDWYRCRAPTFYLFITFLHVSKIGRDTFLKCCNRSADCSTLTIGEFQNLDQTTTNFQVTEGNLQMVLFPGTHVLLF